MFRLIHAVLHDPLLYGLAGLAVLVVAGLLWSDRRAKRRNKAVLTMRRQSREQRNRQTGATTPAVARPPFRLFRWQFVLAILAACAFLIRSKVKVSARGPAAPASFRANATGQLANHPTSADIAAAPLTSSNSVSFTATNLVSSRSGQVLPADLDWQRNPISFPDPSGTILHRPPGGSD